MKKKQRSVISIILALIMLISMLPVYAFASELPEKGTESPAPESNTLQETETPDTENIIQPEPEAVTGPDSELNAESGGPNLGAPVPEKTLPQISINAATEFFVNAEAEITLSILNSSDAEFSGVLMLRFAESNKDRALSLTFPEGSEVTEVLNGTDFLGYDLNISIPARGSLELKASALSTREGEFKLSASSDEGNLSEAVLTASLPPEPETGSGPEAIQEETAEFTLDEPLGVTNQELETMLAEEIIFDLERPSTFALHDTEKLSPAGIEIYNLTKSFVENLALNGGSSVHELTEAQLSAFPGKNAFWEEYKIIMRKLNREYPELMYWAVQSGTTATASFSVYNSGKLAYAWIYWIVDPDYQPVQQSPDQAFTVDSSKIQRALAAKENAKAIAEAIKSQGSSDRDRIFIMADKIIDLVDYDYAAAEPDYNSNLDNDPWAIVHVFDGDPATKVVCEGYSKSFQYLFDMVLDPVNYQCYCVSGNNHMWNIVSDHGQNYFVDVTWYENNTAEDSIMLAPENGKVETIEAGKCYNVLSLGNNVRSYDQDTLSTLSPAVLTLAEKSKYGTRLVASSESIILNTTGTSQLHKLWLSIEGELPENYKMSYTWDKGGIASVEVLEPLGSRQQPLFFTGSSIGGDTLNVVMSDAGSGEQICAVRIDVSVVDYPAPRFYTINYYAGEGVSVPPAQLKTEYTDTTLSTEYPDKPGYGFSYWTDLPNGRPEYDDYDHIFYPGNSITADKDLTLYAVWVNKSAVEDVNHDGYFDEMDYIDIMLYLAGADVSLIESECDYDSDAKISPADYVTLMQYLNGAVS